LANSSPVCRYRSTKRCPTIAATAAPASTPARPAPSSHPDDSTRRCISYLTIELKGSIPTALRPLIGNRVYGCDDCQLYCPWNRFSPTSQESDFAPRQGLDRATLAALFAWSASDFAERLAGSAIRRIGHERWLRNLAVGLGNAPTSVGVLTALHGRRQDPSPLVREHVEWALARHLRG
jgi:epoxyqueuosine reductase